MIPPSVKSRLSVCLFVGLSTAPHAQYIGKIDLEGGKLNFFLRASPRKFLPPPLLEKSWLGPWRLVIRDTILG